MLTFRLRIAVFFAAVFQKCISIKIATFFAAFYEWSHGFSHEYFGTFFQIYPIFLKYFCIDPSYLKKYATYLHQKFFSIFDDLKDQCYSTSVDSLNFDSTGHVVQLDLYVLKN